MYISTLITIRKPWGIKPSIKTTKNIFLEAPPSNIFWPICIVHGDHHAINIMYTQHINMINDN